MKIRYEKPIAEMQGDEMTRILWDWIKEYLIEPYVELKTEFYDLGLVHRDETDDAVTREAGEAIKRLGVGVKCATITPNDQRKEEYNLKRLYPSPNGTIRAILDGTVFRTPILVKGITPYVPGWTKPITIARHAYGDVYKATDVRITGPAKAELKVTAADGTVTTYPVHDFDGAGVLQGMHNTDRSISAFAHSCFNYALSVKRDLWLGTKDTISKIYDGRFKAIFADVYETEYKDAFEKAGINYEYEAAHGTVTRHYYKYRAGESTSTNPVATIFAWSGALGKRGETENNTALVDFASRLEKATLRTIESGKMTGDLALIFKSDTVKPEKLESEAFLKEIAKNL